MKRKIYLLRFIICLISTILVGGSCYFMSKNSTSIDFRFAFVTSMSLAGTFAAFICLLLYQENIILILCKRELKKKNPEIDTSIITLKNFSHIKNPLSNSQYLTIDSSKDSAFFEVTRAISSAIYIDESLTFYSFDKNDGHLVLISTPYFVKAEITAEDQPKMQKIFQFKNGKTYILSFSQRIKQE